MLFCCHERLHLAVAQGSKYFRVENVLNFYSGRTFGAFESEKFRVKKFDMNGAVAALSFHTTSL